MRKPDNRRTSEVKKFRAMVVRKLEECSTKHLGQEAASVLALLALEVERMPLYPWKH